MAKTIRAAKCPEIQIGKQCDNPYACPLHEHLTVIQSNFRRRWKAG
jgi:hypothetical protein